MSPWLSFPSLCLIPASFPSVVDTFPWSKWKLSGRNSHSVFVLCSNSVHLHFPSRLGVESPWPLDMLPFTPQTTHPLYWTWLAIVTTDLIVAKPSGYSLELLFCNISHRWFILIFRISLLHWISWHYFPLIHLLHLIFLPLTAHKHQYIQQFLNYKGRKSNFTSRHQLNQVIKMNIIGETYQDCLPPDEMQWEEHSITSMIISDKDASPIHDKH